MSTEKASTFAELANLSELSSGVFQGPPAIEPDGRTFGGQFLAQSILAASATVDDDRFTHSLHAYFLSAGDVMEPTEYRVEQVRDGRSFSVRSVVAVQREREVFRATLSFQVPDTGLDYEPPRSMKQIGGPNDAPTTYQQFIFGQGGEGLERWEVRPLELLYVNPPDLAAAASVTEPQLMWARVTETLADDRHINDAALAYISDSTLLDHVFLPHGRSWQDEQAFGTTLDHSMWFHRPVRADQWLLFEQSVETTGGTRGLTTARFYTETGDLVATCAQEGLMRWTD